MKRKKALQILGIIFGFIISVVIIIELIFGKTRIEYPLYHFTHKNIPTNFEGYKIIQLSDLHYGKHSDLDYLEAIIKKVNSENPDLVIFTGDMIDSDVDYLKACYDLLGKIEAPLYAVLGNHESWIRKNPSIQIMSESNITLLKDSYTLIEKEGQSLYLAGISDMTTDEPNLDLALDGATKDDYVILLSHNPNMFYKINDDSVNLMYSGHNHGGQVTFFGLFAPYLPGRESHQEFRTGLVSKGDTHIIISNGIGTTVLPVRFFANPQVTITILHSEEKPDK